MNATPDMLATAFKMLAALALVLGGLGIFVYFTKRVMRKDIGNSGGEMIRVLTSKYIGLKKNITLIKIPVVILVIGIIRVLIILMMNIINKTIIITIIKQGSGCIILIIIKQLIIINILLLLIIIVQ